VTPQRHQKTLGRRREVPPRRDGAFFYRPVKEMQDLGGYAPSLVATPGAHLSVSPLLPNTCDGSVNGTSNPDGQCILGGRLSGFACEARPIFVRNNVPYTSGRVAATDYTSLENVSSKIKQLSGWGGSRPTSPK